MSNERQLTLDRQAVKTLWKHSLKVRLQFIPRSVRAATKQSRHMSRVLAMRLLRVIGVGLGLRVVRGAMLSVVGIECRTEIVRALWWHQYLKRLANMGGERGAMWMLNERDQGVCCFDSGRVAPLRPFSIWPEHTMLQATRREQAHRPRRTSRSTTCAGHCQWRWTRTSRI